MRRILAATIGVLLLAPHCAAQTNEMEPIRVSKDGRGFELADSGKPFVPWGHNYVGPEGKLLEDVWEADWDTVVQDFRDMKQTGANVVRVHLQVNEFMEAADRVNHNSLRLLARLLQLAEQNDLYLDITGLSCYRTSDVPAWYDSLSEQDRWRVQARFWAAVAEVGANSPAVFCYDLMNEPVVPGGQREAGQWYSGKPFGGYDFVQFIALDQAGRPRHEIARDWIRTLTPAIRAHDSERLITAGLLPWTEEWGHLSGFVLNQIAPEVDFIAVHIYPEAGKPDAAITVLKKFAVGKPVVIEETFNLRCSIEELRQFMLDSRGLAAGWIGHYGGQSPAEFEQLQQQGRLTMSQAFMRNWLELFQTIRPEMITAGSAPKNPPGRRSAAPAD